MLSQISREIKSRSGPINLKELSAKLDIEQNALVGMLNFMIRKGKIEKGILREEYSYEDCSSQTCASCRICSEK